MYGFLYYRYCRKGSAQKHVYSIRIGANRKKSLIFEPKKYFIGTEDCPLFEDAVASGAMIYSDYKEQITESSDLDALKNIYLEPANATHLLKPGIYNPGNKV